MMVRDVYAESRGEMLGRFTGQTRPNKAVDMSDEPAAGSPTVTADVGQNISEEMGE